jgi:hypothetical protein
VNITDDVEGAMFVLAVIPKWLTLNNSRFNIF